MADSERTGLPRPIIDDRPDLVSLYDFAWRTALQHVATLPSGRRFVDIAWNLDDKMYEWVWDSCFVALYCRYAPERLPGMASLDNFYDLQRADGFISMTYDMLTGEEVYPDRINPPLFAWVEHEYLRMTGDASRLERVVPCIERLMGWIDANRRPLPWKADAASPLYCFGDCGSSGMDDSPRTPRHPHAGRYFEWIDLSAQMALSFDRLAALRDAMGDAGRAAEWRRRADTLARLINERLWCERTRFYHDRSISERFVATKTPAAFWPLLARACPDDRRDALVEHLMDEREFNRPTPLPSLSADDPNYSPAGVYWIGGVWPPLNYMVARGLTVSGRGDAAHAVAVKYLSALARTYERFEPHTLWECNSPEEDKPGLTPYTGRWVKPDFCGWTAIGPIAMLIENVLGIDVDAPARVVDWTPRLTGRHGIEALSLGRAGAVSLLCEARGSVADPVRITAVSAQPLTLRLRRDGKTADVALPAGTTVTHTL